MPEFRSGEYTLYYDRAGDGDLPVIFIHGFLASSRMWRDCGYLGRLPAGVSAYVPDMRGHGKSNQVQSGCDLRQMAGDVAALIRDRELVKPFVVGMSMGGGVGLKLALDYPDLPGGLVLISPGYGSPLEGLKRWLYPLVPCAARKAGLLSTLLKSAFVKLPPEDIVDGLLADAMKVSRETWRQYMHPGNTLGYLQKLNQVKIPVCFIFGEQDRTIPPARQHQMADRVPTAKKVVYRNEGRSVVAESPRRVMKDMFEFIDLSFGSGR